jgi:hypothetical protein
MRERDMAETAFQTDMERVLFTEAIELRKKINQLLMRAEAREQEIFLLKELIRKKKLTEQISQRLYAASGQSAPPSLW